MIFIVIYIHPKVCLAIRLLCNLQLGLLEMLVIHASKNII